MSRKSLALLLLCAVLAATGGAARAQGSAGPAARDEPRFDVLEFVVEGNTVLGAVEIERAVYRHLGEKRTVADVEQARAALERAYQRSGYPTVLVDIPEQRVDGGIVTLRVTEGRVDRVRVTGARYYSQGRIIAQVPALVPGEVPYFPQVQQELATLNRGEDRQVTPVLRPGRGPGEVEVDLKVDDALPLHGSIELNDRYSYDTERLRLGANLRYDNLWQLGHSIGFNFLTTPQDFSEVNVYALTYVIPFAASGNALALYGVRSDSDVASIGDVNIVGRGSIAGARYVMPLRAAAPFSHTAIAGVDYKDFDENLRTGAQGFTTPISYTPFVVQYAGNLRDPAAAWQYTVGANFSVRGLSDDVIDCGGQQLNEFACKRFGAKPSYIYLRGELTHTRALPAGYQFFGRVSGQAAGQPLIANEQFPIGGVESVRGYTEFEFAADYGYSAALEGRTPSFLGLLTEGPGELRALAFFDVGTGRLNDALPGQRDRITLASAGLGLRLRAWRTAVAALDLAFPFDENVRNTGRDPRVHFRVAYEF
jgi:hemolysin activation/secretion protein